jgi:hypothetical protein
VGALRIHVFAVCNHQFRLRARLKGTAVAEDTFIADTDDEEKRHPHYYCDASGLRSLLEAFEPLDILDREQTKPGSFHWIVTAECRSGGPEGSSPVA